MAEGTLPDLDALRAIGPGVTKDQLYQALGRPHFREGLGGVREWDYLFRFRTADGVVACQYKVIFDRDMRGQSFHWLPAHCLEAIVPTEAWTPRGGCAARRVGDHRHGGRDAKRA